MSRDRGRGRVLADALHRLDVVTRERDELAADVDRLAYERDDLSEKLAAARQQLRELLEPEPGVAGVTCTKIRYLHWADAADHAVRLAHKQPGDVFRPYPCRICPPYPVQGSRPFHVGHCWETSVDGVRLADGVLRWGCGCSYAPTGETLQTCPEHGGPAVRAVS